MPEADSTGIDPTSSSSEPPADSYWLGRHEEEWDALCEEFAPELLRQASSEAG